LLTTIGLIYGFTRMFGIGNYEKRRPLIAQLISVVVFVSLCILACFTAFYRTGEINIAPISAFLMSVFFIVYGITFGVYFGCMLFRKHKFLSIILPSLIAVATTVAMYVGELVLMDGKLYIFGTGFLFTPISEIPFSPWDFTVMLLSGVLTSILLLLLNEQKALIIQPHDIVTES